jgi:undecaprenyl phosphate N,N'-diacetylbacillosamine 1-phosphate transferase
MTFYLRHGKRILDFTLALILMVCLSWLFLMIFLVYAMLRENPVFFRHPRIGYREKVFRIIKFRTLKNDEGLDLQNRRFGWGDFLRASNLDELPQLINVLRGDMSFVGPRPLPVDYLLLYSEVQRRRHTVRPGITGWAQVNGRHSIPWQQKFSFDLEYISQASLVMDLRIICKTITLVLAFKKDHSLEEKRFTGNNEE